MRATKADGWYRPRGYLHFDRPISRESAAKIVKDSCRVARHGFYPLIGYTIKTTKVQRSSCKLTVEKTEKSREIRYAAHVDSHIYSYYCDLLSKSYEDALRVRGLDECVLAFRRLGLSNIEFAKKAFDVIKGMGCCSAIAFDVKGFFDNIDHGLLKQAWADLLQQKALPKDHYAIFKSLTRYSTVQRERVFELFSISPYNPKYNRSRICSPAEFRRVVRDGGWITVNPNVYGIPQGTPISALLSNVYLLGFDEKISKAVADLNGRYFRYCDDILVVVPESESVGVKAMVDVMLDEVKLKANEKKTETSQFFYKKSKLVCDRHLQYLGFLFDGQRVLIRSAALAKFSGRMNRGVRLAKATAISRNKQRIKLKLFEKSLYKRKLYERYSHLGHRNFIRYALRAAEIMRSKEIKRQLRPLWGRLKIAIEQA